MVVLAHCEFNHWQVFPGFMEKECFKKNSEMIFIYDHENLLFWRLWGQLMGQTMKAFVWNFNRPERSKQLINEGKLTGSMSEISYEVSLK